MAKNKKLSKQDVKQPDKFQQTSAKAIQWSEQNIGLILAVVGGAFVIGLAWVGYGFYQDSQNMVMQKEFYQYEKPYLEKKEQFAMAKAFEESLKGKSAEEVKKLREEAKKENREYEIASGDMQKDYGASISGFESFISKNKASRPAIFAGLHLLDIYSEYEKWQEGLKVLTELSGAHQPGNLLSNMLWTKKGNWQANMNDCAGALNSWSTLSSSGGENYKTIEKDVRLRMALCHREKDPAKAKEMLKSLSLDFPESVAGRAAKKYLRGLEVSTASTTN